MQVDKHKFDDLSPAEIVDQAKGVVELAAYLTLLRQRNHSLTAKVEFERRALEAMKVGK